MASRIQTLLDEILDAVYGEEVRGAIHDSIEECYSDVSTAKTAADSAVSSANSAASNANSKASLANTAANAANTAATNANAKAELANNAASSATSAAAQASGAASSVATAVTNANNAAASATTAAGNANSAASAATTAAGNATSAAGAANTAAENAQTAVTSANTAANNANAKATLANTAAGNANTAAEAASAAATRANNAASTASDATSAADTATAAANSAASAATTAAGSANNAASAATTAAGNAAEATTAANTAAENTQAAITAANTAADNANAKATLADTAAGNANAAAETANTAATRATSAATTVTQAVDAAEDATATANSAASAATTAASNANDAATLAATASAAANNAATAATESAQSAVAVANTAANNANAKATLANTAAGNANTAAESANTAATRANNAATATNEATAAADTATDAANRAASAATTAAGNANDAATAATTAATRASNAATEATESAQTAVTAANAAANNANSKATLANTAANNANTAANTANQAAASANSAASTVTQAVNAADTATAAANNAASSATAAATAANDAAFNASNAATEANSAATTATAATNATTKATTKANNAASDANLAKTNCESVTYSATVATNSALTAADRATSAALSIEDITVTSETLPPSSSAYAQISEVDGHKNIKFGLVKGENGAPFTIKGEAFPTLTDLIANVANPNVGDLYNVGNEAPYDIYRWTGSFWENQGTIGISFSGIENVDIDQIWNGTEPSFDERKWLNELGLYYLVNQKILAELNNKVDKVSGKGLSTNDFKTEYLDAINSYSATISALETTKVDKINGKGLSTNDYTTAEKEKLEDIEAGAEANVQSDWNQANTSADDFIKNKPANLVQDANYVHTDNNYTSVEKTKLAGIAEGAEANVQADWEQTSTIADDYIKNKPTNLVQDADYVHTDNNYTTAEKTKLSGIAAGAEVNVQPDWDQTDSSADDFIKNKPENIVQDAGYVHTDNNFTTAEKTKLYGIAEGAEVNVQSDWDQSDSDSDDFIKNKPVNLVQDASYVHTDNNYTSAEKTKLGAIEAGAEVNVQSDWEQLDSDADDFIKNKPTNLVQDASYVHTDNNYTSAEKTKLAGIAEGAEINVQSDWNQSDSTADDFIKNKPSNLVQDASYVHTDNNYTSAEKTKLAGIEAGAEANVQSDWGQSDSDADDFIKNKPANLVQDADYVHTDNNYTTTEKTKLAGIADGAEVNVQSDWNQVNSTADDYIKNKPENLVQDASYVHTDNNYTTDEKTKLAGIAEGAEVNVQSDWNQSDATADDFIKNKPTNFVQDESYVHTDNNYTTAEKTKLAGIEAEANKTVVDSSLSNQGQAADAKAVGDRLTELDTADEAFETRLDTLDTKVDSKATINRKTVSLSTTWVGAGPYTQTVTVTGYTITANSKVDLQPAAAALTQLIADGVQALYIANDNGELKAYAIGARPSVAINNIQCTVSEVVS